MSRRLPSRVIPYTGLAAAPDTQNIDRVLALQSFIGGGMNGRRTFVVGVDRGDPTRSLTGPIEGRPSPTDAQAAISAGSRAGYRPTPTIQDAALTNPDLDPYNSLLLNRMRRR